MNTNRIHIFDQMRAVAILMVFNVHFFGTFISKNYFSVASDSYYKIFSFLNAGHIGVDLFFIISGYLIILSLDKYSGFNGINIFDFLKKRAKRLIPAHFVVLVIISFFTPTTLKIFFSDLFFKTHIINYVTWSLSYEWIFYILVVSLFGFFNKRKNYNKLAIAIAVVFFLLQFKWEISFGRGFGFVAGVLIFANFDYLSEKFRTYQDMKVVLSILSVVLGIVFWSNVKELTKIETEFFYLYIVLVWSCVLLSFLSRSHTDGKHGVILSSLGEISYSFYLVHALVIDSFFKRFDVVNSKLTMLMYYPLVFFLCWLLAFFLFKLVEENFWKLVDQMSILIKVKLRSLF